MVPQAGYLELKDSAGHAEMAVVSAEEVTRKDDSYKFALVCNRPCCFPMYYLLYTNVEDKGKCVSGWRTARSFHAFGKAECCFVFICVVS